MAADQAPTRKSPGSRMPKADFVTSVVLMAFSAMVIVLSVRMPRLEHRNIHPLTIPGLVPGILGIAIGIMSVGMFIRAIRNRGYTIRITADNVVALGKHPEFLRIIATLAVCILYAIGLVGLMWYPLATFLFTFVFIFMFEYKQREPLRTQHRMIRIAGIEALITAAAVSSVFRYVFLVRLP